MALDTVHVCNCSTSETEVGEPGIGVSGGDVEKVPGVGNVGSTYPHSGW